MGLLADIHKDLEVGALRLLVEYRARLRDAAVKLCGDETQADDLVFRTIERVLAKPDSYKVDTNLFGWMLSIMENIHLNDIKRPVVRGTVAVDDATMEEYAGADWSTDEQILKNSDCEAVRAALRDIPPEYKQTVILRFYEDLSLKEIASILNKPVGTVGRRIHVALHLLAGKLSAEFGKAKKPLAVLLAALLGAGALFGAWQAGLLDPLLSQKGEAYPPSEASCEAGAMRGESFPLQEEAVLGGAEPQSEEVSKSGAIAQAIGEALPESLPLQEEPETDLTQDESQSETTKGQTMNLKTVKTLAASAVVAASAAVGFPASAGTLPAEYQRVEYIESAGASITLTGFKATSDMTIWIRSSFAQWSGACFLGDGNCRFFGANSPTAYYYDHGSANRSSVGGLVANDVREFELGAISPTGRRERSSQGRRAAEPISPTIRPT